MRTEESLFANPLALQSYLTQIIYESLRLMAAVPPDTQAVLDLVEDMEQICQTEGLEIPKIKAFASLDQIEQFRELLIGLFEGDSAYRFELTAAALKEMARLLVESPAPPEN